MSQATLVKPASQAQLNYISSLRSQKGEPLLSTLHLSSKEASEEIDRLKALKPQAQAGQAQAKVQPSKAGLPLSNYALEVEGTLKFYRMAEYKGTRYLRQLIGHPGTWQKLKLAPTTQAYVMSRLIQDPKGAAKLYADTYTCCAVCNSPLSDALSRSRGIGPVCWARF